MTHLKEGQLLPHFEARLHNGRRVSPEKYAGKKWILFFYPQDDTPTCTKEACNLRDHHRVLKKAGLHVIGISPDTEKKHRKFREKYKLPYPLIADPEKKIIEAFGLWGPKVLFGRDIEGVYRTTFIIDESGRILKIIDQVNSGDHARQILEALEETN